jgi:glycosyltransferase involved in cell wall biosynthesis
MHICLLTRVTLAHGIRGGMERHAELLARELGRRGHRISIITADAPPANRADGEAVERIWYLPGITHTRYSRAWWRASSQAVARLHQEDPIDLVWSQSTAGLGYLRSVGQGPSLPYVAIIHGTGIGELRGSWRAFCHAPSPRGAAILALNLWRRWRSPGVWRRCMARIGRLIAVSQSVANDLLGYLGAPAERIVMIPNGIDTSRFRPDTAERMALRDSLGLAGADMLAIVTGRLSPQKGTDVAIRAVARVPEAHLLVLGSGSHEAVLRRLVQRLGVADRVHLMGRVAYDEVPVYLAGADLALCPSLLDEAFPLSVIEAMASGLPVLATEVGGVATAIRQGEDGYLVPPGSVAALAQRLAEMAQNGALRARMGELARERALSLFDIGQMVDATEAVFQQAVAGEHTTTGL